MNPADLLGTTFACECGKTHSIPTREVIYSETAIQTLPAILARYTPSPPTRPPRRIHPPPWQINGASRAINLVADDRTYPLAGKECEAILRQTGWLIHSFIVPNGPQGSPICDDITRDAMVARLPPCDFFLAVGSGTISDLVKWMACDTKIPYVALATAASMNGYASNNIAPAVRGVKRVLSGTVPLVILAVPSMIHQAPFELTTAGFGDVLAKPVSMTDWKLNQILFDDYYCPLCAQLIRDLEPVYLTHPEAIRSRKPAAMEALFHALIYSGVSMTMAGTSFPASGGEHLISHALDMTATAQGLAHDYHGRQVGLGTIFACALYERVLGLESPCFRVVTEPTNTAYWKMLAPVIEEEHALKRRKAELAVQNLNRPGLWDQIRVTLSPGIRKAIDIKSCLRAAGAAHRIEDIGCTRERFRETALHCHQMRERYTIIDLARAAGILPGAAEEIIEEYLT